MGITFENAYKQAEARALPVVGGRRGKGGKAFLPQDRVMLTLMMNKSNKTPAQLGYSLGEKLGNHHVHIQRLQTFQRQVESGNIRIGYQRTGEHVGKVAARTDESSFDGRIKSLSDVQPAFNRAARQLIKVGITSPEAALKYVSAGFETARSDQKIDSKAERIVAELQIGDLTREQVLETLQRVKQKF